MHEKQNLNVSSGHGTILMDTKGGHDISINNCHILLSPVVTENFIFQFFEGNSEPSSTKEIMTFWEFSLYLGLFKHLTSMFAKGGGQAKHLF